MTTQIYVVKPFRIHKGNNVELKDLIEAGIQKMPHKTAAELAEYLLQNPNAVRDAKGHRRGLPVYACVSLAKLIGAEPMEVISASELVTEKKAERRAVFLPFVHLNKMAPHLAIATIAYSTLLANVASLIKDI